MLDENNDVVITQSYWKDNTEKPPPGTVMKIDGYTTKLTFNIEKKVLEWLGENEYATWDACEVCRRPKIHAYMYVDRRPSMDMTWSVSTCYVHTESLLQKTKQRYSGYKVTINLPFKNKY